MNQQTAHSPRSQRDNGAGAQPDTFADLVALLRHRAADEPDRTAYLFLNDEDGPHRSFSYAALDRRARAIAARLLQAGWGRQRALLLYPPGLAYIEAFFGCLYAGVIAVPAYPPTRHHVSRLRAIVGDAGPGLVMSTESLRDRLQSAAADQWQGTEIPWLATDTIAPATAEEWTAPELGPDTLAFLQYTSGSTGDPRGVMVSHGNLLANQALIRRAFGHTRESTVVGWLPLYHDMGLIGNVLQPLYVGATAVLMSPLSFLDKPTRWLRAISEYRAHTSGGPNFAYDLCVRKIGEEDRRELDLSSWSLAFNGAEPVRAETLERFSAAFAPCGFRRRSFYPCYGLAEATLFVAGPLSEQRAPVRRLDPESLSRGAAADAADGTPVVGCGCSGAGHEVAIVDPVTCRLLPDSRVGEIWVTGPSVAGGYWGRPEDSEVTFRARLQPPVAAAVTGVHANDQPRSYLRTGDLGFLDRGELYVSGRIKDLLIIRGRNYHPGDLEASLQAGVPGLLPGAIAVIADADEQAAVIVAEVSRQHLREHGAETLFEQMRAALSATTDATVAEWVLTAPGAIPRTSSGKLRRSECRRLYLEGMLRVVARSGAELPEDRPDGDPGARPIPTKARKKELLNGLSARLARLLNKPAGRLSPTTDLSALGIDSLRLVALKHDLDQFLNSDVPLSLLLTEQTLDQLASALAKLPGRSPPPGQSNHGALSCAQRAMWTVHQLDPASIAYNQPLVMRLEGRLDRDRLQTAFAALVERHEQLRTTYHSINSAVEQRAEPIGGLPDWYFTVDAHAWNDDALQADISERTRRTFELDRGPLLGVTLYRHGPFVHTMLVCAHHIAVDLWSLLSLLEELEALYQVGAPASLDAGSSAPEPAYADYVAREQEYLAGPDAAADWTYWREQLAGPLPVLNLPKDFDRPAIPSYRGAAHALSLSADLTAELRALAAESGVTLSTLLLTAYKILLHRYTHQTEILVGLPTSGRSVAGAAGLIGNLVNPVAIRSRLRATLSVRAFLADVHDAVREALIHQRYPLTRLVEQLQPERRGGDWPFYQTMFVLQQAQGAMDPERVPLILGEDGPPSPFADLTMAPVKLGERVENFDLQVTAVESAGALHVSFQYATDVFKANTIERLAAHYRVLLEAIVARPEAALAALPLLTDKERQRCVSEWNATAFPMPADTVCTAFEARAERQPDGIAIIDHERDITYRELNRQANRLARALRARGIGEESLVAVASDPCSEAVIALLGIVKAGAVYLPLDPEQPPARWADVLRGARPAAVLHTGSLGSRLRDCESPVLSVEALLSEVGSAVDRNLQLTLSPGNLVYVLYTSGSTGTPKGVAVTHGGLANRVLWGIDHFGWTRDDVILQRTPLSFDVSAWEIWGALTAGARLLIAGAEVSRDPAATVELMQRHGATWMEVVPSLLRALLEVPDFRCCATLRGVGCGGEVLVPVLEKAFLSCLNAALYNLYGPTEISVDACVWACTMQGGSSVPIGRPIGNAVAFLADRHLNPVPAGVIGEIFIGGSGLARGYLGRPDLTAECFIPNPFATGGSRLYRTGDLGRYRDNGVIEFLGRVDHQVKLRGYRIELGEIEARLREHPQVRDAAVSVHQVSDDRRQLVAYIVGDAAAEDLQAFLLASLPDYMVPQAFINLDHLPLTASGKLDRDTLPAPDGSNARSASYVPPRTRVESALADIWADVLGVARVGLNDNFHALGGDSILSIQVASRAHAKGLRLTPRQIFQYPTLANLAQVVSEGANAEDDRIVSGEAPLTPVQRWFFAQELSQPHHFNQAVMLDCVEPLNREALEKVLELLVRQHDALRLRFERGDSGWRQYHADEAQAIRLEHEPLATVPEQDRERFIEHRATIWQGRLDLSRGPLLRAVWFGLNGQGRDRLLLIIHHLVVDVVSWRPLLDDLDQLYGQLLRGEHPVLPHKTTAYRTWALRLAEYAESQRRAEMPGPAIDEGTALPLDFETGTNLEGTTGTVHTELDRALSEELLQVAGDRFRSTLPELLLAALAPTVCGWAKHTEILVDVEQHGREEFADDLDLSRTVGWFTAVAAVRLRPPVADKPDALIRVIKEQARPQLRTGFDRFVQRGRPNAAQDGPSHPAAPILFNYLGRWDAGTEGLRHFRLTHDSVGSMRGPENRRSHEWEINVWIDGHRLVLEWSYSTARYAQSTVETLAQATLARLGEFVAAASRPGVALLSPVDFPLARITRQELDRLTLDPGNIEDIYPLAPMQEGLLFHTLMQPGSGIYLMQDKYRFEGTVDLQAFRAAWQHVVDAHAILRTSFHWNMQAHPHQIVHRRVTLFLEYLDWRHLSLGEQEQHLERLLQDELREGFALEEPRLFRLRLIQQGEHRYRMVRSEHHILLDAWSNALILYEFRENYAALTRGEPLPIRTVRPFSDYLQWLQEQDREAAQRYWRETLAGVSEPTPLVVDRPAPGGLITGEVRDSVRFLSAERTSGLQALAQRHRLTPNTFAQAAWALLISRYSERDEVLFGVTVAGRPTDLPGIESTPGLFINSLPLKVRIPRTQIALDFLRGLLQQNAELRQYEYTPLVEIQALSDFPPLQPLFQHLLVYENAPFDASLRDELASVRFVDVDHRTHTNYPINGVVLPGDRLQLQITYHCDRFEAAVIERMLGHFETLLVALIEHPDRRICDLDGLLADERRWLLTDWNRSDHDYGQPEDVLARFEAQAARRPDAIAAACQGAEIRYGELNRRANRLAYGLLEQGVGPDVVVALLDDRSIDFLVMIVAVFKAGGAYLPLDPAHPDGRIGQVLEESRVGFLLTGADHRVRADAICSGLVQAPSVLTASAFDRGDGAANLGIRQSRDNLAFIIYTSGSTGKPKGAMVEQLGMFNNLITKQPALGLTEHDVIAQTASQCFDISVWQFLTALMVGARVEIFPDAISRDPPRLIEALGQRSVTILEAVPSMISALLEATDAGGDLSSLRWLLPCGEAFPPDLCRRWMERHPHIRLLNAYGPAECSDDVSYHPIALPGPDDLTIPIGRPVHNTQLYVLNRSLQPAPIGVPGEICVGGIQVGRGYLHRPDLTAAVFVPNPFGQPGTRLYRTGDLGRFRADGVLEFLGRIDHQVKIRGHRVEPGEIEACLVSHLAVRETVVVPQPWLNGVYRLVAYIAGEPVPVVELRAHINKTLPDYMVPAAFVFLPSLPLTPNGKVDRKRLPTPDTQDLAGAEFVAPRTPTEEILAAVWSEVLGVDRVGVTDNFFDLGGHSLLATQVMSRLSRAFQAELPLRTLFAEPTVQGLALAVDAVRHRVGEEMLPPIAVLPRGSSLALSRAQQRLWYAQQLDTANPFYNFRIALRVSGSLDLVLLESCVNMIIARHETLRSRFIERNGVPVQEVDAVLSVVVAVEDLTGRPASERRSILHERMTAAARVPFDLERGPLIRLHAYRLHAYRLGPSTEDGELELGLLFVVHHLVFDGWSVVVFLHELTSLYAALRDHRPAALPDLPLQYADYAAWQNDLVDHSAMQPQIAFWQDHLAGAPALSEIPMDHRRTSAMETLAGTHDFDLSAELPDLHRFSRERAVSLFMTSFAALQALMHCLSGARDLVVGADVAGRNRRETEPLIGFFINLLPLRTRLDGDPGFDELVNRVRDTTLAAYAHQDLPFDRLLDIVRPERIPGANPLFQVKLVFHNVPIGSLGLPGIGFEPLAIETGRTELDLVLHLHNQGADFPAVLEYRSDLFEPASVARFAALYRELLRLVLNQPGVTLSELKALLDDYEQRGREQARSARRKADLTRLAGRRGTRISGQSGAGAGE